MQMLWRLNFLVVFLCLSQGTTYILYYICLLHTYFFLMVYVTMKIGTDLNYSKWGIRLKLGGLALLIFIVWDVDSGIFRLLHWPFLGEVPVLGATSGSLWEWYFRSTLDHWSTILGMIFGELKVPFLLIALVSLKNTHVLLRSSKFSYYQFVLPKAGVPAFWTACRSQSNIGSCIGRHLLLVGMLAFPVEQVRLQSNELVFWMYSSIGVYLLPKCHPLAKGTHARTLASNWQNDAGDIFDAAPYLAHLQRKKSSNSGTRLAKDELSRREFHLLCFESKALPTHSFCEGHASTE